MLLFHSTTVSQTRAAASLFLIVLLIAGCKKGEDAAAGNRGTPDPTVISAGKIAFASNGCMRCHTLDGQGGKQGPELTHTGIESAHTAEWFAGFVGNPKSVNPQSRMPSFKDRMSDKDLKALGTYLSTLK